MLMVKVKPKVVIPTMVNLSKAISTEKAVTYGLVAVNMKVIG